MRTARLNVAIFVLTSVVFVLQSVGYLSPAWFVRQYRVQHGSQGFLVDGRRFKLMEPDQMGSDMRPKSPMSTPSTFDSGRSKRRAKLPVIDDNTDSNNDNEDQQVIPDSQQNQQDNNVNNDHPQIMPIDHLVNKGDNDLSDTQVENEPKEEDDDHDSHDKAEVDHTNNQAGKEASNPSTGTEETHDKDNNNDGNHGEKPKESFPMIHHTSIDEDSRDDGPQLLPHPLPDDVNDEDTSHIDMHPQRPPHPPLQPLPDPVNGDGGWTNSNDGVDLDDFPSLTDDMFNNINNFPQNLDRDGMNENGFPQNMPGLMGPGMTPSPDMLKAIQQGMMGTMTTGKRIIHVTAGLWYGRACVNSKNFLKTSDVGTEWCTVYIRTDDSILGGHKNMLEFRIEASLGLGFCLLGLLVASTTCCCSRKQKTRMFVTLLCLFVSGAVMLIPVIHMIVQHGQMGGVFHRSRDLSRFMVHTYLRHDLFDMWSVVLCGCGSLLSVLGSILFTILGCRLQKQSDTEYDLSKTENGMEKGAEKGMEKGSVKKELPINWARNNKITIPSSKTSISTTKESLGGDDSDYYTEAKDEDHSSFGYPHVDSVVIDDVTIDSASGNDAQKSAQTGNDAKDGEDSEVDFLDGVVLDDD